MIDVLTYLQDRQEEFRRHLSIARILEGRVNDESEGGEIVEIRHVNTIKSGLLIHLYNIVEAVTTRTLETVGQIIVTEKPKKWKESVLKEWIRAEVWSGEDRIGDGALKRLADVSSTLASGNSPSAFTIKGEPGSWDDKSIKKVADRLGCELILAPEIKRAALEPAYRNETTAMKYLASRRNAIAHGATTFEDGANDLTLDELEGLSQRVLPFLQAVSQSYQTYLEAKLYLMPEGNAA
jgi:hypothetical protein